MLYEAGHAAGRQCLGLVAGHDLAGGQVVGEKPVYIRRLVELMEAAQ